MKKTKPERKSETRQQSNTSSSKKSRPKTPSWTQGSTPLTTQLPTPTVEDNTPLASAKTTSMYPDNPKESPSVRSKISSIETAIPASIPSLDTAVKPPTQPLFFGKNQAPSLFAGFPNPSPSLFGGVSKATMSYASIGSKSTRLIYPTDSFQTYGTWPKRNFPEHIQTRDLYFVNNI